MSRKVRDKEFLIAFGKKVALLRKKNKLSQYQFSDATDVSRNQIMRIENGEVNTSIDTVAVFSRALKVHPKELLDFNFDFKKDN